MAIGIVIALRGLERVNAQIQRIIAAAAGGRSRTELYRRYGIQALNWINENFRSGGGLLSDGAWKPLSDNTIVGRRQGSSEILQNTGVLRASFTYRVTANEVRVGTASPVAIFHEFGTRGPYPITPVRAQALAFPGVGGSRVRNSFSSILTRKTFKRGEQIVFAKAVSHPGLVKRRMLPNQQELMPRLLATTIKWAGGVVSGGGGGGNG